LDNDTILKQFDEIEKRVERLIGACQTLKAANEELTGKMGRLEAELLEKSQAEDQNTEIKALIRTKIDNLMERLEGVTEAGQEQ
jgi:regulator of replication initiation timing